MHPMHVASLQFTTSIDAEAVATSVERMLPFNSLMVAVAVAGPAL